MSLKEFYVKPICHRLGAPTWNDPVERVVDNNKTINY